MNTTEPKVADVDRGIQALRDDEVKVATGGLMSVFSAVIKAIGEGATQVARKG
jgi:hypothetical protein